MRILDNVELILRILPINVKGRNIRIVFLGLPFLVVYNLDVCERTFSACAQPCI